MIRYVMWLVENSKVAGRPRRTRVAYEACRVLLSGGVWFPELMLHLHDFQGVCLLRFCIISIRFLHASSSLWLEMNLLKIVSGFKTVNCNSLFLPSEKQKLITGLGRKDSVLNQ